MRAFLRPVGMTVCRKTSTAATLHHLSVDLENHLSDTSSIDTTNPSHSDTVAKQTGSSKRGSVRNQSVTALADGIGDVAIALYSVCSLTTVYPWFEQLTAGAYPGVRRTQ
jgi:hypothetical protein